MTYAEKIAAYMDKRVLVIDPAHRLGNYNGMVRGVFDQTLLIEFPHGQEYVSMDVVEVV